MTRKAFLEVGTSRETARQEDGSSVLGKGSCERLPWQRDAAFWGGPASAPPQLPPSGSSLYLASGSCIPQPGPELGSSVTLTKSLPLVGPEEVSDVRELGAGLGWGPGQGVSGSAGSDMAKALAAWAAGSPLLCSLPCREFRALDSLSDQLWPQTQGPMGSWDC